MHILKKSQTLAFDQSLRGIGTRISRFICPLQYNYNVLAYEFIFGMWGALSAVVTVLIGIYCLTAMVMAIVLGCNGNPLDSLQTSELIMPNPTSDHPWTGLKVIGA